jgi:hypothetical protein
VSVWKPAAVHHAGELDHPAVADDLEHAAAMRRNDRVHQLMPQRPKPRNDAFFVGARET